MRKYRTTWLTGLLVVAIFALAELGAYIAEILATVRY